MIEHGEVIATANSGIDVRVTGADEAKCAQCGHCSKVDKSGLVITDVRNDVGAQMGDEVEVEIPPQADVRAGVVVYVMPVVTLLIGYGVGRFLGPYLHSDPDLTGAATAVLGVVAGMLLMRTRVRKLFLSEQFRPRVRAIITRGPATG